MYNTLNVTDDNETKFWGNNFQVVNTAIYEIMFLGNLACNEMGYAYVSINDTNSNEMFLNFAQFSD